MVCILPFGVAMRQCRVAMDRSYCAVGLQLLLHGLLHY